ncbi:AAA family ATPase [Subsaxibacter sp. CAU 1640]|uniref:AAA family ATPase n=1 Tax=Subsaxibacter sp. CAU 1640 TaxID=2933271 RepID=UPI002004719B|nr:AAA family ATPase [Subsaxibacter sp. CAU 1640]MCK7590932.1 AAA family ATPase [Subsaxibacter sp. CAU 1640]
MKSKLTIKKFKRIYDEIQFTNFAFINYFTGENSSGKTSVLNAISFLMDGSNSKHFFSSVSKVELIINGKIQNLIWNEKNPNRVEHQGELQPLIFYLVSNVEQEKGANNLGGHGKFDENISIHDQKSTNDFNEFMKEFNLEEVTPKKFVNQSDPFDQDTGKLIFETGKGNINPHMLADGLKVLFNFKKRLKIWFDAIKSNDRISILIIEEPETNLHPKLQKQIPEMLNNLYENLDIKVRDRTFFFISTHSPFIISSSARYANQKVYPLQNGKPLLIDFSKLTYSETDVSEGYEGSQCAFVVGQMLGAEITDLGYPENYVILEEHSLQVILDNLRNKGIIKNIQFVSASGISKSIDLAETVYELEKINTLIKCNPYYFDKYCIIIDHLDPNIDSKLSKRILSLGNRIGQRFVQLSKHSIEEYYSNIDPQLYNEYKKEIGASSASSVGNIKAKYAIKIANLLSNANDFSKLFMNELDFLL